jgi:hypothetical protein
MNVDFEQQIGQSDHDIVKNAGTDSNFSGRGLHRWLLVATIGFAHDVLAVMQLVIDQILELDVEEVMLDLTLITHTLIKPSENVLEVVHPAILFHQIQH